MSLPSPQRHTPIKGRVVGSGMTGGYGSPLRNRFERDDQSLPTVVEDGSNGSAFTDVSSISGGSSSQFGHPNATSRYMTASRGPVNNQMSHSTQQLPTTPQQARRMTVPGEISPSLASPSYENFAWSVLINPATQNLEHPNGSVDMEWARRMCIMSLNCMEELIRVVRNRPNDWRRIVCDVPFPVKQAIVAFPDLCQYYEALQHDAHEAFGGRL